MLTKGIALDLAPSIRANTICPGTVRTEMTRYIWESPEHRERAEQRAALKRLGDNTAAQLGRVLDEKARS